MTTRRKKMVVAAAAAACGSCGWFKWLWKLSASERCVDVKEVLLNTFLGPAKEGVYSPSVQATLYEMAKAVLERFPDISFIQLRMPNLHFLPVNLPSKDNPIICKADWKALHSALVGCLALLRRKTDTGMINKSQAKVVAESYLKYLQVQSLGQQDRKLCLQILECLLDRYRDALFSLYLQVQSVGQQDRKLCLQILECLLNRYRDALFSLVDESF